MNIDIDLVANIIGRLVLEKELLHQQLLVSQETLNVPESAPEARERPEVIGAESDTGEAI